MLPHIRPDPLGPLTPVLQHPHLLLPPGYLLDERDMLIQRLATAENLAAGILEAAINEDVGEQVSKALTDLALYGVTLG